MSKSTKPNGYSIIPNCIYDVYMRILPDVQFRVLESIVRKTLGWKKRWDEISLTQFEKMTARSRPAIIEAIEELIGLDVILCKKGEGRSPSAFALNSGYESFDVMVNSVNQLNELTSKDSLLQVVNSVNRKASVVVNSVNPQKKDLSKRSKRSNPHTTSNVSTKQGAKKTEADQMIGLLIEKFKLPTPPPYTTVNGLIYRYGILAVTDAVDAATGKATSKTWKGVLAYIEKCAKNISAQSRGVSGEELDRLEKEYRDMIYDMEKAEADLEKGRSELGDSDPKIIEGAKWVQDQNGRIEALRFKIQGAGGNTDVRR